MMTAVTGDVGRPGKARYLVRWSCGMSDMWWWIWAVSPAEITLTCAEVEVVTDAATQRQVRTWAIDEADLDALAEGPLADLRDQRREQRKHPSFGVLAGRSRVCLRLPDPEDPGAWRLSEHDRDGRRIRQVEQPADGPPVRTGPGDWPLNPPFDLYDPELAALEISAEEFESAWRRASPEPG
jgi:hypothetical protein